MLTIRQLARAITPPLIIATVMPLAVGMLGMLWLFIVFKTLGVQGVTENAERLQSASHAIARTEGILPLAMVVWAGWRSARQLDGMLTAALSGAIVFAAIRCEELVAAMYVHKTHLAIGDLVLDVVVLLLAAGIFGGILGAIGGFLSARRRSVASQLRT